MCITQPTLYRCPFTPWIHSQRKTNALLSFLFSLNCKCLTSYVVYSCFYSGSTLKLVVKAKVKVMLLQAVSRPFCRDVKYPSGAQDYFFYCHAFAVLLMWSTHSDERIAVSFIISAGPRQRSHSRVRVPRDS
jgi:hypothetical protein